MYEIDLQTIRFSNGKKHNFPTEIVECLEFEESIVVRLATDSLALIQNIFGLDYTGNILWKMPKARTFEARTPYVSLFRKGGYLEVLNWDGHLLTLHPKQGVIMSEDFYSGGDSRRYQAPSRRRWI